MIGTPPARRRTTGLLVALVAGALALAACSSSSSGSTSGSSSSASSGSSSSASSGSSGALSGSITVAAASSLTGTFTALAKSFESANPGTTVTVTFGSSGALATDITNGQAIDVFASAAPKNMQTVIKAGDATSSTDFVKNSLEIAVPPSNPAGVTQLSDLARSGVKVGLCVLTAPCGATAATMFAKAKLTVNPVGRFADVKTTLTQVESGNIDAGVVYVTDVKAAGAKVKGIEIPAASDVTTEYPIAVLKGSKNAALAQAFVTYIQSPAAQSVLTAAGFQAP